MKSPVLRLPGLPALRTPAWQRWLFAIGLLVLLMQGVATVRSLPALAGPTGTTGTQRLVELCTAHGIETVALSDAGTPSAPTDTGSHECCLACVLGAPTPPLALTSAVLPALTFEGLLRAGIGHTQSRPTYASPPSHAPPVS